MLISRHIVFQRPQRGGKFRFATWRRRMSQGPVMASG